MEFNPETNSLDPTAQDKAWLGIHQRVKIVDNFQVATLINKSMGALKANGMDRTSSPIAELAYDNMTLVFDHCNPTVVQKILQKAPGFGGNG